MLWYDDLNEDRRGKAFKAGAGSLGKMISVNDGLWNVDENFVLALRQKMSPNSIQYCPL